MAAGNAARFGGNKLAASVDGKTMLERALEAVPREALSAVCVVTQYDWAMDLARRCGFACIRNDHPDWGISYTIRLGTRALADRCAGIVYQVADQPLLRRETVEALVGFFRERPSWIAAVSHNGVRGNPCVFPAEFFPELLSLTGDNGGSAVIRRHPDRLRLWEADDRELTDVDTPEELDRLTK